MKKTKKVGGITVFVSRFTEPTVTLTVEPGTTVADVLEEAGIRVSSSESLYCNGQTVGLNDQPEDQDVINLVGKKDGGLK